MIVKLKKLRLMGLSSQESRIMDILSGCRQFEVLPTAKIKGMSKEDDSSHLDKIIAKRDKLYSAINYILANQNALAALKKQYSTAAKKGESVPDIDYKQIKSTPITVGFDDLYDSSAKEFELLGIVDALEKYNERAAQIKQLIAENEQQQRLVAPFSSCPIKFSSAVKTKTATVVIAASSSEPSSMNQLDEIGAVYEMFKNKSGCCYVIIAFNEHIDAIMDLIALKGMTVCPFDAVLNGEEFTKHLKERRIELKKEAEHILLEACSYDKYLRDFKIYYDYLSFEVEKSVASMGFLRTKNTFVVEGWLPENTATKIIESIQATAKIVYELTDPTDEDVPPTLVTNKKIIEPFELITNMYSPPSHNEFDPNPIMSIFYFLFFGIMIGDAGYGIIMAIGAWIVLRRSVMGKGARQLVILIGVGGISSIIWGILFGGFFGIEGVYKVWFSPLDDPLTMLLVSIVLGVIHLSFGIGINGYKLLSQNRYIDFICDVALLYGVIIGVVLLALGAALGVSIVSSIGSIALFGSIILIFCTAGRKKSGIGAKLAGGISGLYRLINLFSDVLSYLRLFGLVLAGAAIAMAFNIVGGLVLSIPIIGIPMGAIVLAFLHIFNMGIGVLGAYVNDARLQFLEFFSKFYVGGGRLFDPMGVKTKYVMLAPIKAIKN